MAKVLIPPAVEAEIEAIGDYIGQDDPSAARRLMERLHERCRTLSHAPERGRPYGERYRAVIEGNYLIFYRIEKTVDETLVVIVAIIHGARDIERILEL